MDAVPALLQWPDVARGRQTKPEGRSSGQFLRCSRVFAPIGVLQGAVGKLDGWQIERAQGLVQQGGQQVCEGAQELFGPA